MRIINKRKFITSILIFILAIISVLNFCFAKAEVETEEYVVSVGETLWSIARENKKDGQDIREYIYELRQLNNLEDCVIYPNQVIKIIK